MRITNVMLGRSLGGLEQALLDYDDALGRFGHEVHNVIHPDAALRPALEARGAVWHALPHLGAWDPMAAMRLRWLLRRLRPDLNIAHGNRAVTLLSHAGAEPMAAVMPNYKIKCRGVAAALCPSLDLVRYAVDQGVSRESAYHIPYMVQVPAAAPVRERRQVPVIGSMGRFVAKKGFEIFIAALGRLRAQHLEFRAILGGDGPERADLERLAAELGLRDVLAMPGWISDKPAFFADLDIFCLPSHHEPFGIVLIEAMAHGLPIVATDSEGPSEILRHGADGILVPRGDVERLADALGRTMADPHQAALLAAGAYRHARESFDVARVGARLDAAVRRVVHLQRQRLEATA